MKVATPSAEAQKAAPHDYWLDDATTSAPSSKLSAVSIFQESFGLPKLWFKKSYEFVATTPGMMTLIAIILSLALLAAGYSMARSSESRESALNVLISSAEPTSAAAQTLYTSLSVADTTATTGFVQAGVEQPVTRERYQLAIKRASTAATQASVGVNDVHSRELELIAQIQQDLTTYVGLVETARTNNREGNPVGVAYMSEASGLMRTKILPSASELLELTMDEVNSQQNSLTRPQWIPISGLVAALIMLILAQHWLAAKTRRRFNRGFVAATLLMVVALGWVATSNWLTWHAGEKGFEEASTPLNTLTNARVSAQEARTAETLTLVRRESTASSDNSYSQSMHKIEAALDEYSSTTLMEKPSNESAVQDARAAIEQWRSSHESLRTALDSGDFQSAADAAFQSPVSTATGQGGQVQSVTTASAFEKLDASLSKLVSDARQSMRSYIYDSLVASRLVATVVLALSIISVLAIWVGIRPRLQEYL